jgi:hypothetical protein
MDEQAIQLAGRVRESVAVTSTPTRDDERLKHIVLLLRPAKIIDKRPRI